MTKLLRSHTVKLGGEWRHNRDLLLQTQDAGGSRGLFNFNASGTGHPTDNASLSGVANSFASFLLDWPNGVTRDLKVIDEPGTQHSATFLFLHDKWQARPNLTIDLGLRWEYYTPLDGPRRAPAACRTTTRPPTRCACRATATRSDAVDVKNTFTNFEPRTGVSWRLNQETVLRAGYGASTIPFPDNRYAFNYPVKQNYSGSAANGFQAAGIDGDRLSGADAGRHPVRRHHPGLRLAPELDLRRHPRRPARGHAALLERRRPAAAAVPAHGRHRLRRQPRRQPGHGRRREREPHLRLAATSAGRSSRRSTAPARRASAATRTSRSTTRCR